MKNIFKFVVAWAVCTLIRLIPGRPPNFDPILAVDMPFSRRLGPLVGFFFAFTNMFVFDAITGHLGMWTWVTSITYGVIGFVAPYFFGIFQKSNGGYISFSVLGILFFDLVTGVLAGPILFGGSFMEALVGQIPFTGYHLVGGILFAALLSPMVDMWIVQNRRLEFLPRLATVN